MMKLPPYPLLQVLDIKRRRVEEAEKVLKEKLKALEKEKEILKEREKERDKVLKHQLDKLAQLRHQMDTGHSSVKIQQMKSYLEVVEEKLEKEEKKVKEQQKQVEKAEAAVEEARNILKLKQLEVDKLELHQKDWLKMMRMEIEAAEGKEMDELGNVIYLAHQRAAR